MNPDIFLSWFEYATKKVGSGYFGHAERVYCYELYHYIRDAMHHYEKDNGPIGGIYLHSELVKRAMTNERAKFYEVYPLDGLRVPDFLFHTPGSFDNQIAAIEVKANGLSYSQLTDDLYKLAQLRQNYQYQLAIFHCVNIDIGDVIDLLREAVANNFELDPNILILCKPAYKVDLISVTVGDLLRKIA
ncbi:hypothetical protein RFA56_000011 [Vibrio alginolyticus]|nr:hypothetical protein [Vibrio alginolyticus]